MFSIRRVLPLIALIVAPALAQAQATDVIITNPVYSPGQVITPPDSLPVVQTVYVVAGEDSTTASGDFDIVPYGYRLIIDYMAMSVVTPFGQRAYGVIKPCDNINGAPWGTTPIVTTTIPNSDGNTVNFAVTGMHLYADPSCRPKVIAVRSGKTGNFGGHITLQGHYAKIPPSSRQ